MRACLTLIAVAAVQRDCISTGGAEQAHPAKQHIASAPCPSVQAIITYCNSPNLHDMLACMCVR